MASTQPSPVAFRPSTMGIRYARESSDDLVPSCTSLVTVLTVVKERQERNSQANAPTVLTTRKRWGLLCPIRVFDKARLPGFWENACKVAESLGFLNSYRCENNDVCFATLRKRRGGVVVAAALTIMRSIHNQQPDRYAIRLSSAIRFGPIR